MKFWAFTYLISNLLGLPPHPSSVVFTKAISEHLRGMRREENLRVNKIILMVRNNSVFRYLVERIWRKSAILLHKKHNGGSKQRNGKGADGPKKAVQTNRTKNWKVCGERIKDTFMCKGWQILQSGIGEQERHHPRAHDDFFSFSEWQIVIC